MRRIILVIIFFLTNNITIAQDFRVNIVAEGMFAEKFGGTTDQEKEWNYDQFSSNLLGAPGPIVAGTSFDLKLESELHFRNRFFVGIRTERRVNHTFLINQTGANLMAIGRVYNLYGGIKTKNHFWQFYAGIGIFDSRYYTLHNEVFNADVSLDNEDRSLSPKFSIGTKFYWKNAFIRINQEFGITNYSYLSSQIFNSNFQIGLGYNFIKIAKNQNEIGSLNKSSKRIYSLNRYTVSFDLGYSFNSLHIPFSEWSAAETPSLDGLILDNEIIGQQTEIPSNFQFRNYEARLVNNPKVGITVARTINQYLKFSYSFAFKQMALQHAGEFRYNSYVFNDTADLGYAFQSNWTKFSNLNSANLGFLSKFNMFSHNMSCHIGKQFRKMRVNLFLGPSVRFTIFDELPGLDLFSISSLKQGITVSVRDFSFHLSHEVLTSKKVRQYGYTWHSLNLGVSYTLAKFSNFKNIVFE